MMSQEQFWDSYSQGSPYRPDFVVETQCIDPQHKFLQDLPIIDGVIIEEHMRDTTASIL